jgi:hypothetical protein
MNVIERIKKSYDAEMADYKNAPSEYIRSNIWNLAQDYMTDIDKKLNNFGSDTISTGISLVKNEPSLEKMEKDFQLWYQLTKLPFSVLNYPQEWGLKGEEIDIEKSGSFFVLPSSMRMSYYAKRVSDLVSGSVVEIGGGFGGLAFHLFRDLGFKASYINFDIPPANLVSKFFLMNVFPEKKFLLYGENKAEYDIAIMPHYAIRSCPPKSCDMVFNAHSLAEMGTEQMNEYMSQIDRISKKYFLHFNHDCQAFDKTRPRGELMDLNSLRPPGWKKVGKWLETLSESEDINYFEYLYETNN